MKNSLMILMLLVGYSSHSQVVAEPVHSFLRPDDKILEFYYGGPNFFKDTPFSIYGNDITPKTGVGHLGFRFENMISTKFSVGVETAYVAGSYEYHRHEGSYDPDTGYYIDSIVTKERSVVRAGVIALFTVHKSAFKNFDYFFTGGMGYQHKKISGGTTREYVFPIAYRLAVGVRYYPTPNFSLGMTTGMGQGGILNVGMGFKF